MQTEESGAVGVVLLNMGGPERLADVEPCLFNLFSDREIIRLGPAFLQKPLARLIARRRAPKSRRNYELIGGGSPLARITREQGEALAAALETYGPFRVFTAMRYWHPLTEEALAEIAVASLRRLVLLSLYPHYSRATTGSSLARLKEVAHRRGYPFETAEIRSWPSHPGYVTALAATIREGLARFSGEPVTVVYSAHSLPVAFIKEGDPYVDEIRATIGAVEAELGITGRLCFQSRSGPVEWLRPSTPEMLSTLAGEGVKNVLMVPISFVSDHVETLYEIDILYRDQARSLGMRLERSESLNTRPRFIAALVDMVLTAASSKGW